MDKNKVYKELLKSKVKANFSYYAAGKLYYQVKLEDGLYEFPIWTVTLFPAFSLSEDLGITPFFPEMKGSELNRWIARAIDKNDFIKISK